MLNCGAHSGRRWAVMWLWAWTVPNVLAVVVDEFGPRRPSLKASPKRITHHSSVFQFDSFLWLISPNGILVLSLVLSSFSCGFSIFFPADTLSNNEDVDRIQSKVQTMLVLEYTTPLYHKSLHFLLFIFFQKSFVFTW